MPDAQDYIYLMGAIGVLVLVFAYLGKASNVEGMTGGFGTITGLAFNNPSIVCKGGNLSGSSSPFCENSGYVLV